MMVLIALLVASVFLVTRLSPSVFAGVSGVDVWYHLICAREMRRQGKINPSLKAQFIFEPSTRYPPLFAAVLSAFSSRFLRKRSVWIGICIDAIHLLVLCWVSSAFLGPSGALTAAAIYAVHPTLGLEYSTLSPRSLASLFVSGFFLSAADVKFDPGWTSYGLSIFFFTLVLLTNKLATQLLLAGVAVMAFQSPSMAVVPVLGTVLALALSGGHYREVLRGHVEILKFWRSRVQLVGAHQVLESKMYFDPVRASSRFYSAGMRGFARLCRTLLAHDPFLPFVALAVIRKPSILEGQLIPWLAIVYCCALGTTFIGPLRFLGQGYRYLKFAAFPEAWLLAVQPDGWVLTVPVAASLYVTWRLLGSRRLETSGPGFVDLVSHMRLSAGPFAVFPGHLANRLAFETTRPVLWGGQSLGYDQLNDWVPVLKDRAESLLRSNGASQLVLDDRFVPPEVFGPAFAPEARYGSYYVLRLEVL